MSCNCPSGHFHGPLGWCYGYVELSDGTWGPCLCTDGPSELDPSDAQEACTS